MTITNDNIIEQLEKVINKILFMKKKDLFQFQGVRFYPSEIHLMLVLDERCATNATKIAQQLGITKGAVSQTLSRLEKKGVLTKSKDPAYKNELTATFTSFGAAAFKHYKAKASEMLMKYHRSLGSYTDKEKAAIYQFLSKAENILDDVI